MAVIGRKQINGEWWYVAELCGVPILRNLFLTGAIIDCIDLGLEVAEVFCV